MRLRTQAGRPAGCFRDRWGEESGFCRFLRVENALQSTGAFSIERK